MSLSSNLRDALWAFKQSRKAKVITLVVLLLIVVVLAGYVLFAGGGTKPGVSTNTSTVNTNVAEVQQARRAIDGVVVPLAQANNFPVGVMIENLVSSRPQAGLNKASLVYEALAEGGITRFLAVYASSEDIKKIGPVRSARSYYLDWASELKLLYVHAGGSPDALTKIASAKISDFNQFFNGQYFWRDKDRLKQGTPSEHTLYTSSELLARAIRDKSFPVIGTYSSWSFADDPALAERPTADHSITVDFSTFNYKVEYRYDRATNAYARLQAEKPHVMEDGSAISVKNVVVQYIPARLADSAGRLAMDTIGEGQAVVFHDGQIINATWKKTSREDRTRFSDTTGKEVIFTAGPTWIEVVPNENSVSYT